MRVPVLSLMALPLLAACTVGPDYERPQVAGVSDPWSSAADSAAMDMEPWRAMGDAQLTQLIERAATANLDLRQADAHLREARAGRDAATGAALPQASVAASATEQQLSTNGQLPVANIPGFDRRFSLFDAGFDASWEIDLWGGNRRAVEAAERRVEAADAQRREVRLRVVAEVVRAYAELRGAQAEIETLRSDAEAQRQIATLMRQSYETGEVGRSDDATADAQARSAEAALPGVHARIRAAVHALALLTAQPPEALLDALMLPAPIPRAPDRALVGLRSDVLRRRPDIAAAEAQLAAATADVGVETANLFPKLSLMGSVGQQARETGDLTSGGSTRFQFGPSLSWPIFAGGRIRAQIRAADARADAAGAAYEQAVLGALADSETALNRYNAAIGAARDLHAAHERSQTAFDLARQRYKAGEDDFPAFLAATTRYNAADRAARNADMQALTAYATLVKALGGGWKE